MRVDFEVIGDRKAASNLKEIGERASDARPALKVARGVMEKGLAQQFSSRGGHFGGPWEPDAPGTLARKARMGQGAETLVATGALRESLTGGKGRKRRLSRTATSVGTSLWYAVFAQSGTESALARKVVGMSKTDRVAVVRLIERYVIHGRVF